MGPLEEIVDSNASLASLPPPFPISHYYRSNISLPASIKFAHDLPDDNFIFAILANPIFFSKCVRWMEGKSEKIDGLLIKQQ